jgi:class 3 adenylate cyclase
MDTSRQETYLAILFADISSSVQIYEILGDEAAQKLLASCLSLLSEVTTKYQGTVIKTIGDEVMCTFPNADLAREAAKDMQLSFDKLPITTPPGLAPPSLRVGFHVGPVVRQGDDVFGDAVNLAARMVSLAKPRQILTTEQTVEALTLSEPATVRCIDTTRVRGKREEVSIHEVIWEQMDVTLMSEGAIGPDSPQARLNIRFGDELIQIERGRPFISLGRHQSNDLVVDEVFASRSHCRIEYRRGKFVLVDQSTNGTYVSIEGGESAFLRRDEMALRGSGIIGLGRQVESDSTGAVHFSHEF